MAAPSTPRGCPARPRRRLRPAGVVALVPLCLALAAPASAPAALTWTTADPARLAVLPQGAEKELLFVVGGASPNGTFGRSRVTVDYVEVEVRYRHQ